MLVKNNTEVFLKGLKVLTFSSIVMFLILNLSSCVSYKKIPYFQNVSSDTGSAIYVNGVLVPKAEPKSLIIRPGDILYITIQTIDPQLNGVMGANSLENIDIPQNGNSVNIPGYLVDKDSLIELPLAGKINVGGLTTEEAKEKIRLKASLYYKDPIVNLRIVNFKVTIIGEVMRPGTYFINGEKATLLDALGQSGDLSIYGLRTNVLLIREEDGHQKLVRFDLTSSDIFQSPYFNLKQGDVIYVQPSKGKAASNDAAGLRYYAMITSTLSLLVVILTRI